MPRGLNPELLRTTAPQNTERLGSDHSEAFENQKSSPLFDDSLTPQAQKNLMIEVSQLRKALREVNSKVDAAHDKIEKLQVEHRRRIEGLHISHQKFDTRLKEALNDLNQKLSLFTAKITERNLGDHKMQEIMDRHNQIVQRFDAKMKQIQSVVNEQEVKIMGYTDTLKEIRRQLPPKGFL